MMAAMDGNATHNASISNNSIDLYTFLLGPAENYNIYNRAMWVISQPDMVIAFIVAVVAVVFNMWSMLALSQVRGRISSYTRLIMSLSVGDIIIGLSVIVYIVTKIFCPSYYPGVGPWGARLASRCMYIGIRALSNSALISILLHLMLMALDHYVAITNPLHYPVILSNKCRRYALAFCWALSLLFGFSDFFTGVHGYKEFNLTYTYCEIVWLSNYHEEYLVFVITFICLVVMMIFYIQIYLHVRRHHKGQSSLRQGRRRLGSQSSLMKRNTKTLFTTLLILGSFVLCWLPNCLFQIVMLIWEKVDPVTVHQKTKFLLDVNQYLVNLLLLNSLLDPIIYSIRLQEVRQGFVTICRRCCCCGGQGCRKFSDNLSQSGSSGVGQISLSRHHIGRQSMISHNDFIIPFTLEA